MKLQVLLLHLNNVYFFNLDHDSKNGSGFNGDELSDYVIENVYYNIKQNIIDDIIGVNAQLSLIKPFYNLFKLIVQHNKLTSELYHKIWMSTINKFDEIVIELHKLINYMAVYMSDASIF